MEKKLGLCVVLALALCLVLGIAAFAEDDDTESTPSYLSIDETHKTITVSDDTESTDTNEIQAVINYIAENYSSGDDAGGWTIVVEAGTYSRFFISEIYKDALTGLTVKAADGATVIINVVDGSNTPTGVDGNTLTYSDTPDMGGVYINVPNVTISGLTFIQGDDTSVNVSDYWYAALISTYNNQGGTNAEGLTITNCTFEGKGTYYGVMINQIASWTVTDCTFDNFTQAIYFDENHAVGSDDVTITGNTFKNCSFAVHGSFGYSTGSVENNDGGKFVFDNNTVIGTSSLRCKVVVQDYYGNGAVGSSSFSGNTLENAMIGLVNLKDATVSDAEMLKAANTLDENSYVVVTESENGDEGGYGATIYFSPESSHGYWALTNITDNDDLDVSWGKNPDGADDYVKQVINEANASGSNTLIFNVDTNYLIRTFTWFKDAIYWVGSDEDEEEPSVTKSVDESTVEAGDTVTFTLNVSAPEYLDIYGTTSTYNSIIRYPTYVEYKVTVHDEINSIFAVNDDFVVSIDGTAISTSYYEIVTSPDDDCDFEIVIDFSKLLDDGLLVADSDGTYPDVVITYTATVAEGTAAGTYENTTWVTYETDGKSETSTVTVTVPEPEENSDTPDTTTTVDNPTTGGPDMLLWLAAAAAAALILAGTYRKKVNR